MDDDGTRATGSALFRGNHKTITLVERRDPRWVVNDVPHPSGIASNLP